ncbi:hypothetical protein [Actinocatenispora rupis]|nr:hypothetical protein [Actinocatenispora rupis]
MVETTHVRRAWPNAPAVAAVRAALGGDTAGDGVTTPAAKTREALDAGPDRLLLDTMSFRD